MNQTQSQRSLANICLFCGEKLNSPSLCTFCGFKFCDEHKPTENHQCIKTRYSEYIRNTNPKTAPNIVSGNFRVVCENCGFNTTKGVPIEYAGEELVQHTQVVGCSQNIFLEEVKDMPAASLQPKAKSQKSSINNSKTGNGNQKLVNNSNKPTSIVDQIIKLSDLKQKGMISEEEFNSMKKELIKKLQ